MKLATHTVVGFPDLATSLKIAEILAAHSAIVELQIPFSDPVADGPTITAANAVALGQKVTPPKCFAFAAQLSKKFPATDFFLMTYFNTILHFGLEKFAVAARQAGVRGFVVPDLPVEEAGELLAICRENKLDLIFVVAPNTPDERLKLIAQKSTGWIYATARLGITGSATEFGKDLTKFLTRIRQFSQAEIGVGFGVKSKSDLQKIQKAGGQIGIVGSELFRQFAKGGVKQLEQFLKSLR
ncbi:MAG: tryptophan synthase subunit alpha [Patescibacteria group bacterium]